MNISTGPRPAKRRDPALLYLYGKPKVGKTSLVAALPGCYLMELDPRGADFLTCWSDQYTSLDEVVEGAKRLRDLPPEQRPKYLAVDTADVLEDWAEKAATIAYKKSPAGANFKGDSVLELEYGKGYFYLRSRMQELILALHEVAPTLILLGHVRDSQIGKELRNVASKDLNLTGKVRQIVAGMCDLLGYLYRDPQGNLHISMFCNEDQVAGSRCPHLLGKDLVIGTKGPNGTTYNWNLIFQDPPTGA